MTVAVFTTILMFVSGMTALFTEGFKNTFDAKAPNAIALIMSALFSVLVCVTYAVIQGVSVDLSFIVLTVWEIILSALTSMVGFDKVSQLLKQLGSN